MLKVEQLSKSYDGKSIVDQLHLHIKAGEAYGLLGPNGAGKSTTIGMISGLIKPQSGSIMIGEVNMLQAPKQAQRYIGIVPQEIALYLKMTARENLMFWGRMYGLKGQQLKQRVAEVLQIIGLEDRANDKVGAYSGGMKRRVNIGAAILHEPQLLIMDEPTVGIDPQSRNHILQTVKQLNEQGMTIIYTSHYMEEVEYLCTRIGIIDHGKLLAEGSIEQLQQLVGNATTIHIHLEEAVEDEQDLLAKLVTLCEGRSFTIKESVITTLSNEPQTVLVRILPLLEAEHITISKIDIQKPNLETVFLHLTGRSLRD
ncbi:ABC transporter ATP-binding protein [Paenibacillus montaniterrae]|uniref:ABC transporter ATP-binding protein n=1 Tax=Paenibacillus montaniterrae TaxID=429341 RepID=UPI001BD008EB|nr:ABC transporter ATP-binding protein [Paenibacillus montaniterrae]